MVRTQHAALDLLSLGVDALSLRELAL